MSPLQGESQVVQVVAGANARLYGQAGEGQEKRQLKATSKNPGDQGRRSRAGPGPRGSAVVGRAGHFTGQAGLATAVIALVGPDRETSRGLLELAPGETGQRLPLKGELFGCSLHAVFLSRGPKALVPLRPILKGARWLSGRALVKAAEAFHRFDFRQPFARASASVQNQASPRSGEMTVLS